MAHNSIEDIPLDLRKELEKILDSDPYFNWSTLISHLPGNKYRDHQIQGFRMKALEPGGSPTRALLNDLSKRNVSKNQLAFCLNEMISQRPHSGLQGLIAKLQGSNEPLTITRQPDEIYQIPIGGPVYIKCEASSSSPVNYQWFKRKQLLHGRTQSYLHIEHASTEDEGYYICRVADGSTHHFSTWAKMEIMHSSHGMAQPIITTQPQCPYGQSVLGGILHLYCDAVGDPAPSFQWYKDNKPITIATSREYNKANIMPDDEGMYQCVASNSAGQAFSDRVIVKVCKTDIPAPVVNKVSDKVALLIGNKDYQHRRLGDLYHPTNDVCDLAGALRSIGFKVVSLVNLTLSEMRTAVKQFYEMLDQDMYALFYFAGHGFEYNNQSYIMPVDASARYLPQENMSASEVIKPMQQTKAKLNIVMLDSCRTQPKRSPVNPTKGVEVKEINVVIVFPCLSKNAVFESESHTNGFFAYNLLRHIGDDDNIYGVIMKVSKDIYDDDIRDPNTEQRQIVYTASTLTDQMSLKAPIDPNAPSFKSAALWKAAHEIPKPQVFKEGGCTIELRFYAEFSNVLLVQARLLGEDCHAFILEPDVQVNKPKRFKGCIYERINEKAWTVRDFPLYDSLTQAIRIKDLQRLQDNLEIELEIQIADELNTRRIKHVMDCRPLYAQIVEPYSIDL